MMIRRVLQKVLKNIINFLKSVFLVFLETVKIILFFQKKILLESFRASIEVNVAVLDNITSAPKI